MSPSEYEIMKIKEVLKDVVSKHNPSLLPVIDLIGKAPLTEDMREALREAVGIELMENGLEENDEPNGRGYMLEDLIDDLGHL